MAGLDDSVLVRFITACTETIKDNDPRLDSSHILQFFSACSATINENRQAAISISALQEQLNSLREEQSKRTTQDVGRDLEGSNTRRQLSRRETEVRILNKELGSLQKELERKNASSCEAAEHKNDQVRQLKLQIAGLNDELMSVKTALSKTGIASEVLKAEVAEVKRKSHIVQEALNQTLRQRTSEIEILKAELSTEKSLRHELEKNADTLAAQIQQMHAAVVKSQLELAASAQEAKPKDEFKPDKNHWEKIEVKREALAEMEVMEKKLIRWGAEMDSLRIALVEQEQIRIQLERENGLIQEQELQNHEKLEQLQSELAASTNENTSLKQTLANQTLALDASNKVGRNLELRLSTLQETCDSSQACAEELRVRLEDSEALVATQRGTIHQLELRSNQEASSSTRIRIPRAATRKAPAEDESDASSENDEEEEGYSIALSSAPAQEIGSAKRREILPPRFEIPELINIKSFRKASLNKQLGGGLQALICRIGNTQTSLAKEHGISCFLAPQIAQNSWCPTCPGQSGYMFVGLGSESATFTSPDESYPLFVGIGKSQLLYCGTYAAIRVEGLSVEEWKTLPDTTRVEYVKTTRKKGRHLLPNELRVLRQSDKRSSVKVFKPAASAYDQSSRNPGQIRQDYDSGRLVMPCVLLRFLSFNWPLYHSLKGLDSEPPQALSSRKRSRESGDCAGRFETHNGESVSRATRSRLSQ